MFDVYEYLRELYFKIAWARHTLNTISYSMVLIRSFFLFSSVSCFLIWSYVRIIFDGVHGQKYKQYKHTCTRRTMRIQLQCSVIDEFKMGKTSSSSHNSSNNKNVFLTISNCRNKWNRITVSGDGTLEDRGKNMEYSKIAEATATTNKKIESLILSVCLLFVKFFYLSPFFNISVHNWWTISQYKCLNQQHWINRNRVKTHFFSVFQADRLVVGIATWNVNKTIYNNFSTAKMSIFFTRNYLNNNIAQFVFVSLCLSSLCFKETRKTAATKTLRSLHFRYTVHNGYCCLRCLKCFVARETTKQRLVFVSHIR